jgi:hypothetical protein
VRSKIRKILVKELRDLLVSNGFLPVEKSDHYRRPYRNFVAFMIIHPMEDSDGLAIDVAWSRSGEFPYGKFSARPQDLGDGEGFIFRMNNIWAPGDWMSEIWHICPPPDYLNASWEEMLSYPPPVEEVLPLLPDFVKWICERFESDALPYFAALDERLSEFQSADVQDSK